MGGITTSNITPYRSITKDLKLENSFSATHITEPLLCSRFYVRCGEGVGVRKGAGKNNTRKLTGSGGVDIKLAGARGPCRFSQVILRVFIFTLRARRNHSRLLIRVRTIPRILVWAAA